MKTEVVPLFDLFHLCETAEKALSKELITNRGNLRGGIKKKDGIGGNKGIGKSRA